MDISDTEVRDISVTSKFSKLRVFKADRSKIETIDPLFSLTSLQKVFVDQTTVHDITAQEFLEKNPKGLIVYKTIHLNRWWRTIPESWKEVFRSQLGSDTTSTSENLHRLVEMKSLRIKEAQISDLSALSEFVRPEELHFSSTAVTDVTPLANFTRLKSLHITGSPLQNIDALAKLSGLEDLDISNTPIDDLRPISGLAGLKNLNAAGTQIKRLDPLETLKNLEQFDCSNTFVNKLEPLYGLPLKTLKCFNTKIPTRRIEDFKSSKPGCNVIYYR